MKKKLLAASLSSALVFGTLSAAGTGYAATAAPSFSDINNSYAKEAIQQLVDAGILTGVDGGKFDPKGELTRAQFITIMVKSMGLKVDSSKFTSETFKDVTGWAAPYVDAAFKAGIIKGTGAGMFSPNGVLTREAAAVILVASLRTQGKLEETVGSLGFKDADQISPWAREAVAIALQYGLIKGNPDGTFNPKGLANREQAAVMGMNFIQTADIVKSSSAPSSTPAPSAEPTLSPPPSPSPSAAPAPIFPIITPSPTPTPEVTPTPTPEATPTPTPTPSPETTPVPTPETTPKPTPSPSPTVDPVPTFDIDPELSLMDGGGLLLTFSNGEAINLGDENANVTIKYYTVDEQDNRIPIRNTIASSDLVKDKTWDGYLASTVTPDLNYSKGTAKNEKYSDEIPAAARLGTIVKKGFHSNGDMNYVQIDWNESATYLAEVTVTNAYGKTVTKTASVSVEAPVPTFDIDPELNLMDGGGLLLTFSNGEAINLGDENANVTIKYYTVDEQDNRTAIRNTIASADLVKDKTWDGYLASTVTPDLNYSKGTAKNEKYSDEIPAAARLGTIVRKGFHSGSEDMNYVEIDWNESATYLAEVTITNAYGQTVTKNASVSVEAPVPTFDIDPELNLMDGGGLLLTFSNGEAINLADKKANVTIKYFTVDNQGNRKPITNSISGGNLVKDKTWDGYLASTEMEGVNYSKGTANNPNYFNEIPALAGLGTIVKAGFHSDSEDMDYVEIDWNESATYLAEVNITNAYGQTVTKTASVSVEAPVPTFSIDPELNLMDGGGLLLTFSNGEAINLADKKANVTIKYFTVDNQGNRKPITNSIAGGNLVKDKTWDGYLASTEMEGVNYSKGTANNPSYFDEIPALAGLGTIVKAGFHSDSEDMDYVEIDWNDPATYLAEVTITNAYGETIIKTATASVKRP